MFSSINKRCHINTQLQIDYIPIERVNHTKFLGVIIDENLTWKAHIQYISNKLAKSIGILNKARRVLNKKSLHNLYYTFVYPYLTYYSIVWASTYPTNLKRLEIIQKKIIRLISGVPFLHPTADLFANLEILKISQINQYQHGMFICRFNNLKLSSPLPAFIILFYLIYK